MCVPAPAPDTPPGHLSLHPLGALGDGSLGHRKCLHSRAGLLHQPRAPGPGSWRTRCGERPPPWPKSLPHFSCGCSLLVNPGHRAMTPGAVYQGQQHSTCKIPSIPQLSDPPQQPAGCSHSLMPIPPSARFSVRHLLWKEASRPQCPGLPCRAALSHRPPWRSALCHQPQGAPEPCPVTSATKDRTFQFYLILINLHSKRQGTRCLFSQERLYLEAEYSEMWI